MLPVTSLRLIHNATSERISTGIDWLDDMFGGQGFFRASTVLLSGGAGTARRPWPRIRMRPADVERAVCFQFEESPAQYTRNMRSVGESRPPKKGCSGSMRRGRRDGLEFHLATMHREVDETEPSVVVVDPLSSFSGASLDEVSSMVMR